jgi:hypothetical protein
MAVPVKASVKALGMSEEENSNEGPEGGAPMTEAAFATGLAFAASGGSRLLQ